jgi:lipopolysaccharide assembly outer membrane protein LptD (OstA)
VSECIISRRRRAFQKRKRFAFWMMHSLTLRVHEGVPCASGQSQERLLIHSPTFAPRLFKMKPIFRAAVALLPLFLAGCARKTSVSGDERAALQTQAKRELAGAGKTASEGAAKSLAGARFSGGQIQIGDAQGRPLYRIEAREIRALSGANKDSPTGALALDARATLFKDGKSESSFQAGTIQLFGTGKGARLQMTGDVVATSGATGIPVEVRAPRADVDIDKRVFVASGGTVAKRGDVTLRAPQLRGQSSLQTLSGNDAFVSSPNAQVRAKSALFNWKTNHLSAQTVTLARSDLQLAGARLDADTRAERGILVGGVSAKGKNGTASGPRLDFNWKGDRLFVPMATFQSQNGTASVAALTTDSKLRVTDARDVRISQNGATLTAQSARGFDNLSRLSASGVTVVRGDLRLTAPQAQARDWSKQSGVIVASGGVSARSSAGTLSARNATWTGDAQTGHVVASGNVIIRGAQGTLRGQSARSDAGFKNAQLSGSVSGTLRNGTQFSAREAQKRGENYIASCGASARLRDGSQFRAARVEGSGQNALATGGASGSLRDGTRFRAARVEKQGDLVVATGGASGVLPDGSQFRAARVEKRGQHILATGGADGRLPDGTTLRAERVEKRGQNIVATGGASGRLPDGTTLRAARVEKRGANVVASGGAVANIPAQGNFGRVEVRAARVEGPLDRSQLKASGGVILTSQSGAVVRAPRAVFNRRTKQVTASGGVTAKDPAHGTSSGESLVADLGLKQITLLRGGGQIQTKVLNVKGLF